MAVTKQSQAIQTANGLIAAANQLMSLYQQMTILDAAWTDDGVANVIAAMGTVALNTDGSLGTADGAPNVANPLNPVTYPALARAISSNQIGQLKTILDAVVAYINGSAVSTQASARPILNAAIGG